MNNLTVIVPYRNERAALSNLLATLPMLGLPVIVIDDMSEMKPAGTGREKIIRLAEHGYFSGAVNAGIAACDTDVLVLNQDTWVEGADWLAELDAQRRQYAMIGTGVFGHPAWPNGYVQGIAMFMRRDAIRKVGLLERERWPLWGATAEWQARACRAGFKALPLPDCDWAEHARKGNYGAAITQTLKEQPSQHDLLIRTPPLVSVVTACHNYGRYLPDLVASLIGGKTSLGAMPGQTFRGFDLTIVDDASTDNSLAIAKSLADPWKGVHVLSRKTRGGTAVAMNDGVKASHGRWIAAIDADDMLEPETLDTMLRVVEADEYAVPYADRRVFADGQRAGIHGQHGDYDFEKLLDANMVPAGIMVSRSGFDAAGGYPVAFANGRQDWALAVALGRAGYCGKRISKPLYLYRREGQNRTLGNTDPVSREQFKIQMMQTFPDLYKGERPMGCCGGGARRAQARAGNGASVPSMIGSEGMILIEYTGGNVGRTAWRGDVTGARYTFSGSQRVRLVDVRDVQGLLATTYDRKKAFRRYVAPTPKAAPTPTSVPEPEPVTVEAVPAVEEVVEILAVDDPVGKATVVLTADGGETFTPGAEAMFTQVGTSGPIEAPKRKYTRKPKAEAVNA